MCINTHFFIQFLKTSFIKFNEEFLVLLEASKHTLNSVCLIMECFKMIYASISSQNVCK